MTILELADTIAGDSRVTIECLDAERGLPLVIRPAAPGLDPVGWAREQKGGLERRLMTHGAILFREFDVREPSVFEAVAQVVSGELAAYHGSGKAPRKQVSGKVYTSTTFPADRALPLHSDGLSMFEWPTKIFFYCVTPSTTGGQTPIADMRRLLARLDPDVRRRFEDKNVLYARNFGGGLAVPWQAYFPTTERREVEELCRKWSVEIAWTGADGLRTRQIWPAIAKHPRTGEAVWFNQTLSLHLSNLPPEVRGALLSAFAPDDLPVNIHYGDGSPIEDEHAAAVRAAALQETVAFPWQRGDILMLDNMLVAHGRAPFTGPREIVVTMADPISLSDLA